MEKLFLFFTALFSLLSAAGQTYTSYFTGTVEDMEVAPSGGVCMMGGAGESDPAAVWFLEQANGGDVLVFRTSGADGYNPYFYDDLGVTINSVETIVFHDPAAAFNAEIHEKIQKAEAIWFAGGNQWTYLSYWRDTPVDSLIRLGMEERNMVVGGTSAGMAILGDAYFSAEMGTVTSAEALANPYTTAVTVDTNQFIRASYLSQVITDTHYDDPDRKGRQVVFMARMLQDFGMDARGIACDEYTAVCIHPDGLARVYGSYPDYDDNAYFLQMNCERLDNEPENCVEDVPLTWNNEGSAIRVYRAKGTPTGEQTFDLSTWGSGVGGEWQFWSVVDGELFEEAGMSPDCDLRLSSHSAAGIRISLTNNHIRIESPETLEKVEFVLPTGQQFSRQTIKNKSAVYFIPMAKDFPASFILVVHTSEHIYRQFLINQ